MRPTGPDDEQPGQTALDLDTPSRVRDGRASRWCWMGMDEALVETVGPLIGPTALAICATLAARAGRQSQKCWPTARARATHWSLGLATGLRAIATLEWWALIHVARPTGGLRA